jgi:type IV pilus assembly protein PilQ
MRARYAIPIVVLTASLAAGGSIRASSPSVRLLDIRPQLDGGRLSVLIEASAPVAYAASQPDPLTVLVDLRSVGTSGVKNRIASAVGPLANVSIENTTALDGTSVARVRLGLAAPQQPRVRSQRNTIHVEFDAPPDSGGVHVLGAPAPVAPTTPEAGAAAASPEGEPATAAPKKPAKSAPPAPARAEKAAPAAPEPAQAPAPAPVAKAEPMVSGGPARGTQAEKRFTGHPVSLDFDGVDLSAVLRTFAEITGLNIVVDRRVEGKVNVALRDVPWDQALDIILRANQLGYSVEGNIIRIAPLDILAQEEKQRRELAEQQALSGEMQVFTKTLSYARASQLAKLVTKAALSTRGTVEIDDRTNTLIITDLPARIESATALLNTLDRPEPQVEIEARIVQTTREFARSIGVQWGFTGTMSPQLGNTTGLAFPNQGSVSGRTGDVQGDPTSGRVTPSGVSLAAVNPSSGIGLAMGAINGAFNLDVALTALEKQGKGRVLSTPRVSTQNNIEAEVTQGVQIPIQTVANNTVTVTFKDAALTLKVKPQITAAGTVIMKVTLENASPDYSRSVNGIPPIDTQRAMTEVLVSDGFTTVIGGIFVSREASVNDRTPGLASIPILGWLFKRDTTADESRELLIFITPRIIKS